MRMSEGTQSLRPGKARTSEHRQHWPSGEKLPASVSDVMVIYFATNWSALQNHSIEV